MIRRRYSLDMSMEQESCKGPPTESTEAEAGPAVAGGPSGDGPEPAPLLSRLRVGEAAPLPDWRWRRLIQRLLYVDTDGILAVPDVPDLGLNMCCAASVCWAVAACAFGRAGAGPEPLPDLTVVGRAVPAVLGSTALAQCYTAATWPTVGASLVWHGLAGSVLGSAAAEWVSGRELAGELARSACVDEEGKQWRAQLSPRLRL